MICLDMLIIPVKYIIYSIRGQPGIETNLRTF
jgi:hypothetical protein